jgi:8-oxo-dGTP pyrophosphatase MutT (NUDIX family)
MHRTSDALLAALEGLPDHADVARLRAVEGDPWSRDTPLHATASALILDRRSGRVLLRWHERQQAWLQVGGHADEGEDDPWAIALREGAEETGLADLTGDPRPVQLVIVPVPATAREPAHEHADVRYLLFTQRPQEAAPESDAAPLRWLTIDEAIAETPEENLREFLRRVRVLGR